MARYDIFCLHTIVGYAPAHAAHWSVHADGDIDQSRDSRYRSAANLNGNHRVLAVETEDHGPEFAGYWKHGSDVPPWTKAQIESLAKIAVFCYRQHGIPLVRCPNSRPGSRGIAFHRQGIDGNFPNGRVSGGEVWSSSTGKVCPGDRRIAQIPQIIKRARQMAGLEEGNEMELTDKADWDKINDLGPAYVGHKILGTWQHSSTAANNSNVIVGLLKSMQADIDETEARILGAISTTGGSTVDVTGLADALAVKLGPNLGRELVDALVSALAH
jgi:hypothetical protein